MSPERGDTGAGAGSSSPAGPDATSTTGMSSRDRSGQEAGEPWWSATGEPMGRLTNDEIEVIRGLERFLQAGRKICSSKNGFPLWFQASLNLLRHALKVGRLEELREYRHDPLPSIPPQEETADWHQTLVDFSIATNSPDEGSDRLRITIRGYPNPETRSETTWPTKSTIAQELQKLPERIREVRDIINSVEARSDTPEDVPLPRIGEAHKPKGLPSRRYRKNPDTETSGRKLPTTRTIVGTLSSDSPRVSPPSPRDETPSSRPPPPPQGGSRHRPFPIRRPRNGSQHPPTVTIRGGHRQAR